MYGYASWGTFFNANGRFNERLQIPYWSFGQIKSALGGEKVTFALKES